MEIIETAETENKNNSKVGNHFRNLINNFDKLHYIDKLAIFIIILLIIATPIIASYKYNSTISQNASTLPLTTINVNSSLTITSVPSRFEGLSFEISDICNIISYSNTKPFIQLLNNLGPMIFRIGGNSVDKTSWSNITTGSNSCIYNNSTVNNVNTLTPDIVSSFFQFASRIDAKVMWTLNLKTSVQHFNPSSSKRDIETFKALQASEAYTVVKDSMNELTTNSSLLALGIGNEPDLYGSSYSVDDYIKDWDTYKNNIKQITGQRDFKFMGDDGAYNNTWFKKFVSSEDFDLNYTSRHYYPKYPSSATTTIAKINYLISPELMQTTKGYLDVWKNNSLDKPLAIDETNSANNGGTKGVSNSFASALWAIDYMFSSLESGVSQLDFHTGGHFSTYSPISYAGNNNWIANPLYYAMLFFHTAAPNGSITYTNVSSQSNVAAHSVVLPNGNLNVVLINKESVSENTQVNLDKQYLSPKVIYLTAPSLYATSGVTFGNISMSSDGTLNGTPTYTTDAQPSGTNSWSILLPANTAAILSFTPITPNIKTLNSNTLTLIPTDNSYVSEFKPKTNYATALVKNPNIITNNDPGGSKVFWGLFKFDLTLLKGKEVQSAIFNCKVTNGTNDKIDFYQTDTNWNQGQVTWENKPKFNKQIAVVDKAKINTIVSIDVTKAVASSSTFSLGLINKNKDNFLCASKESTFPPTLSIITN